MSNPDAMNQGFMQAAQASGGIQPLLRGFFSFLHQATDFYIEDDSASRPIGFAPGQAEALVLQAFRALPMKGPSGTPKPAAHRSSAPAGKSSAVGHSAPAAPPAAKPRAASRASSAAGSDTQAAPAATSTTTVHLTDSGKQVPIGNGGIGPDRAYAWTQSLTEVTITVPAADVRARDVRWHCTHDSASLTVGGQVVIDGKLGGGVRPDDCVWTMDDDAIIISLEKTVQTWWRSAVAGHPEIDATLVDSTRSISSYDDDTQATICKLLAENQASQAAPEL